MTENLKRAAAQAAIGELRHGMRLGLGTGSTASQFVELVGIEVAKGLQLICVPTSEATAAQARALGIPLTDLETTPELDLTVDGADEIGPGLALVKGGGGALLREKIVAAASKRMVVIADDAKLVPALGRYPLPVEVNLFGIGATARRIEVVMAEFEAEGALERRLRPDGTPFLTDGGHAIFDASFGRITRPQELSNALLEIPGVVQHGLFLKLCHRAYVAGPTGVEVLDANVALG